MLTAKIVALAACVGAAAARVTMEPDAVVRIPRKRPAVLCSRARAPMLLGSRAAPAPRPRLSARRACLQTGPCVCARVCVRVCVCVRACVVCVCVCPQPGVAPSWEVQEACNSNHTIKSVFMLKLDPSKRALLEETFWAVSDPANKKYGKHLTQTEITVIQEPPPTHSSPPTPTPARRVAFAQRAHRASTATRTRTHAQHGTNTVHHSVFKAGAPAPPQAKFGNPEAAKTVVAWLSAEGVPKRDIRVTATQDVSAAAHPPARFVAARPPRPAPRTLPTTCRAETEHIQPAPIHGR